MKQIIILGYSGSDEKLNMNDPINANIYKQSSDVQIMIARASNAYNFNMATSIDVIYGQHQHVGGSIKKRFRITNMRKLFLLLFSLYGLTGIAQTITEKYNSLMSRYEYYNSSGNLIGYKTYDNLKQTWNYYEITQKQQNTYVEPVNLELINKALAGKQARLDNNVQKIEYAIEDIGDKILSLDVNDDVMSRINDRFTNILDNLNAQKLNYNSTSVTSQVINWLYTEINKVISEETYRAQIPSQKPTNQNIKNGTYVTLFRKATIWDVPDIVKAKSLGEMESNVVYVIEKTNSKFYKIKSGNIIGYVTVQNFK